MVKTTAGVIVLMIVLVAVCEVDAQELDWAGARAEGMGGAFIGVADDAISIVGYPTGFT